jgi:glycosyltransferase involved in cell wall biosynthesis
LNALRVAVVMPPEHHFEPAGLLDALPTFTKTLDALLATGTVEPVGYCRSAVSAELDRHGVHYVFEPTAAALAARVGAACPDVVHVHGLGFSRLVGHLRRRLGAGVPIVLQHHGEPPPATARTRLARRITRRWVSGYLFTGATQAEPFRSAGAITRRAAVCEVLESASHLDPAGEYPVIELSGRPAVLWVGRLIPSKDPLCAVSALAAARANGSEAELHMLATDRTMEPEIRRLIANLGVNDAVHVHPAVENRAMGGWYQAADVYLSTSHREGSNYSLIEALGFGCYPVVTDIASHAAIVQGLVPRFAAGDAAAAGTMLGKPTDYDRDVPIDHSQRLLSWAEVAEQVIAAYRRAIEA